VSVIIGCDSFLALRNVRNGDLGRHLDNLVVLVDPNQLEGSRLAAPGNVRIEPLQDFRIETEPALHALADRANLARKTFYDPVTRWNKMIATSRRAYADRSRTRLAVSLAKRLAEFASGWLAGAIGQAIRWRRKVAGQLGSLSAADEYRRLFKQLDARIVAGFSPEGLREMLLLEAARTEGVPTMVMIRSRDNLSSKILHLPLADRYLVWSDVTRSFFLKMYPEVNPDSVIVTGSPQFDHHLDPRYRLDRREFFERMELDSTRPLIVYTTATPGLIDHEINITQHLADAAHHGRFARGAQLLVRGHPRMFGSDLRLLHREYPEAKAFPKPVGFKYQSPEHEAQVVRLILEDEPLHLATLAYQDVQVNVCGTMTIDSAILDKPTVNVYYDIPADTNPGCSVRRFYTRSDVKQMMDYGTSRLARDPEQCIELINQYLEQPELDAEGRRRARESDCGPLDGKAGGRIAEQLRLSGAGF